MKNIFLFLFIIAFHSVSVAQNKGEQMYEPEEEYDEQVFVIVEEMPHFKKGYGKESFRDYIAQNLQYPEAARKESAEGTVYVQFVVNKEGYVQSAKVIRGTHPALDKEALRVVNNSPQWEVPGKQRSKPVHVQFVFPLRFELMSSRQIKKMAKKNKKN